MIFKNLTVLALNGRRIFDTWYKTRWLLEGGVVDLPAAATPVGKPPVPLDPDRDPYDLDLIDHLRVLVRKEGQPPLAIRAGGQGVLVGLGDLVIPEGLALVLGVARLAANLPFRLGVLPRA